ncbi:TATA box-binding protein-associated factor RNA polymerase I subunit C [Nowakowskiella sp. JEL0078]|nr:TATA box-binding protein-associated factor RNA polymerase I subunit C [Nowakowskiella sp. JEL0078]
MAKEEENEKNSVCYLKVSSNTNYNPDYITDDEFWKDDRLEVEQPLSLEVIDNFPFQSTPMHVSFSPHIPGESIVILENGDLFRWSETGNFQGFKMPKFSDENASCQWRFCSYGAHPCSILIANETIFGVIDTRRSRATVQPLFDFKTHERWISCFADRRESEPFEIVVGTNKSIFLFDVRYTVKPVLEWEFSHSKEPIRGLACAPAVFFSWTKMQSEINAHLVSNSCTTFTPQLLPSFHSHASQLRPDSFRPHVSLQTITGEHQYLSKLQSQHMWDPIYYPDLVDKPGLVSLVVDVFENDSYQYEDQMRINIIQMSEDGAIYAQSYQFSNDDETQDLNFDSSKEDFLRKFPGEEEPSNYLNTVEISEQIMAKLEIEAFSKEEEIFDRIWADNHLFDYEALWNSIKNGVQIPKTTEIDENDLISKSKQFVESKSSFSLYELQNAFGKPAKILDRNSFEWGVIYPPVEISQLSHKNFSPNFLDSLNKSLLPDSSDNYILDNLDIDSFLKNTFGSETLDIDQSLSKKSKDSLKWMELDLKLSSQICLPRTRNWTTSELENITTSQSATKPTLTLQTSFTSEPIVLTEFEIMLHEFWVSPEKLDIHNVTYRMGSRKGQAEEEERIQKLQEEREQQRQEARAKQVERKKREEKDKQLAEMFLLASSQTFSQSLGLSQTLPSSLTAASLSQSSMSQKSVDNYLTPFTPTRIPKRSDASLMFASQPSPSHNSLPLSSSQERLSISQPVGKSSLPAKKKRKSGF